MSKETLLITTELLKRFQSPRGGWNRQTVEMLGASWPLRTGWKKRLIGRPLPDKAYDLLENPKLTASSLALPATEKQINYLIHLGVAQEVAEHMTRRNAHRAIESLRDDPKPTQRQISYLRELGADEHQFIDLTRSEVSGLVVKLKQKKDMVKDVDYVCSGVFV